MDGCNHSGKKNHPRWQNERLKLLPLEKPVLLKTEWRISLNKITHYFKKWATVSELRELTLMPKNKRNTPKMPKIKIVQKKAYISLSEAKG